MGFTSVFYSITKKAARFGEPFLGRLRWKSQLLILFVVVFVNVCYYLADSLVYLRSPPAARIARCLSVNSITSGIFAPFVLSRR